MIGGSDTGCSLKMYPADRRYVVTEVQAIVNVGTYAPDREGFVAGRVTRTRPRSVTSSDPCARSEVIEPAVLVEAFSRQASVSCPPAANEYQR